MNGYSAKDLAAVSFQREFSKLKNFFFQNFKFNWQFKLMKINQINKEA